MPILLNFGSNNSAPNPFVPIASDGAPEPADKTVFWPSDDRDEDFEGCGALTFCQGRFILGGPAPAGVVTEEMKAASQLAREARRKPIGSPERTELAEKALLKCPHCPDALYILGIEAKTRDEALRWFEKGVDAGPLYAGAKVFERARREGKAWESSELRGFYRCLFGAANVLRRMGRYEEAYPKFKQLLEFESRLFNFGSSINPYPSFIECLLGLGRWGEAASYLFSGHPMMTELARRPTSYLTWTYTRVLVALKLGRAPELPGGVSALDRLLSSFWEGACPHCAERVPTTPSREALKAGHAASEADPVLALLAGEPLPEARDPPDLGFQSAAAARSYVRQFGRHWRAEPGILSQVIEMDRIVRRRCGGTGPRRECPLRVIAEFGCQCCGFKGAPKPPAPPARAPAEGKAAAGPSEGQGGPAAKAKGPEPQPQPEAEPAPPKEARRKDDQPSRARRKAAREAKRAGAPPPPPELSPENEPPSNANAGLPSLLAVRKARKASAAAAAAAAVPAAAPSED